uniref:Phage protein n=1 Tax=Strongyloides venezuelensis TaxID=75913 RepID=A0A0K0FWF2_STRVS
MKVIINLSYNKKEHQYVNEIKFCRKVNVIEKIINDGYDENTCYTRVPVVTEDKEIRFADDKNYLNYETTTINCL